MSAIAVDAMGGDNAPEPEVAGAVAAVREGDAEVILVGDRERLEAELAKVDFAESDRLTIEHASEVVTMDDHPGKAFRTKRDSSLRVACNLVKSGRAAGLVSAGNSGAVLSHALFVLGRLTEVERPGIVTTFPTPGNDPDLDLDQMGTLVLCDMGANVEVRPTMLAQFGVIGAHYDRIVHGHDRPRVGLLSNGSETSKGTELTRESHELLGRAAEHPDAQFEYVGYVEGSDLLTGVIDVVATDGFTGNVVLKVSEGVSQAVLRMVKAALTSSFWAKLGASMARSSLLSLKQRISYSETGGALLAGVHGEVIIAHGRSDALAIKNAIKAAGRYAHADLAGQLQAAMSRHKGLWDHEPSDERVKAEGQGG